MPRKTIQDFQPAFRAGYGTPINITLADKGSGVTAATNDLDRYTVSPAFMPDRSGVAMRITDFTADIADFGSGATSGSWTVRLFNVTQNVAIGTAVIAYNATAQVAQTDLRDGTGKGVAVNPGDTIRLDISGVPAGTLSGGAKGTKAHVTFAVYGIRG